MIKRPRKTSQENSATPAEEHQEAPRQPGLKHELIATIPFLALAVLVIVILYSFVLRAYVVDGLSMWPTLNNSDRLVVGKLPITFSRIDGHAYVPGRGDIVIFNQSGLPGYTGTKQLVKRVVGLPGERIVIKNGQVKVYNSTHPQGFDPDSSGHYKLASPVTIADQPIDIKLGPHQVYVLGDNRQNSEDSRVFGPIDTSQIIGQLWLRIWPINQLKAY